MLKGIPVAALLLILPSAAVAQVSDDAKPAAISPDGNAEMAAIFAADQGPRKNVAAADWEQVRKADAERRKRTRELLDQGKLTTARDFWAAAFVFQHGDQPEDYLLAHALAVRSLGLGLKDAEWIAAATLDRYLESTGKSQIYGTQFLAPPDMPASLAPYDTQLLPDSLRSAAGAGTLDEQRRQVAELEARRQAAQR